MSQMYFLFSKISNFIHIYIKNHYIFVYKNKYTYKFDVFAVKADIKNVSGSRELRWENHIKLSENAQFVILFSESHCP